MTASAGPRLHAGGALLSRWHILHRYSGAFPAIISGIVNDRLFFVLAILAGAFTVAAVAALVVLEF